MNPSPFRLLLQLWIDLSFEIFGLFVNFLILSAIRSSSFHDILQYYPRCFLKCFLEVYKEREESVCILAASLSITCCITYVSSNALLFSWDTSSMFLSIKETWYWCHRVQDGNVWFLSVTYNSGSVHFSLHRKKTSSFDTYEHMSTSRLCSPVRRRQCHFRPRRPLHYRRTKEDHNVYMTRQGCAGTAHPTRCTTGEKRTVTPRLSVAPSAIKQHHSKKNGACKTRSGGRRGRCSSSRGPHNSASARYPSSEATTDLCVLHESPDGGQPKRCLGSGVFGRNRPQRPTVKTHFVGYILRHDIY